MAEQNFTLTPGQVTPLTAALAAGATIINTHATAAVWIGATPNTGPGLGVRLGPKGSTSWTTDGAPVYAAPDTGVTAPVVVTISSDMAPPVNPVDVGVAVAAQLLTQGVPNVLTGDRLLFPGAGSPLDVSAYSSLTVTLSAEGIGSVYYDFGEDQVGIGGAVSYGGRRLTISSAGFIRFTVPVTGPYFILNTTIPAGITQVQIYGSNRTVTEARVCDITPAATVNPSQAWTSGTAVDLNCPFTTNGGWHEIRLATTQSGSTVSKGFLQFPLWDSISNTLKDFSIVDTNEGHTSPSTSPNITEVHTRLILPPGRLGVKFLPFTTGTYQVVCQIIPLS